MNWTPWHKVVALRDDLKSGELTLSQFAADLDDVVMGRPGCLYKDPADFFALTYPTFNLRELAKDVVFRLAGASDKAVRQLVLTYGGGKTHALITLYHLANDPDHLPDLPAVQEFRSHIGRKLPRARIATLTFDRLDAVQGMEVRAPDGSKARLKYPWSVLAFQLGGQEGLQKLGMPGGSERETPPATNVLEEILALPKEKQDLSTLVLIDEVLLWARTQADIDPAWCNRLQDFFQCLTQAATRVHTCAVVASLLSSKTEHTDEVSRSILNRISDIFGRVEEEPVEPVVKEDVSELLRRRFFKPETIRDPAAFRPHVVAAIQGLVAIDEKAAQEQAAEEERFLKSYPFHPDLTDVFYAKWAGGLERFQRTRGVLRTFALALRDAEKWDEAPLISANVFLAAPGAEDLSDAARELASVASTEEHAGQHQEWRAILVGEFGKARRIQKEFPHLQYRELEQAVFAAFLHSQPIGQKALTRELVRLVAPTRPDKIELEQALCQWAGESWYLDEEGTGSGGVGADGRRQLPQWWQLGFRPNLKQMHDDAMQRRVSSEMVESLLLEEIGKLNSLTQALPSVRVHKLPEHPRDVEDDGEFHYVVLGPKAASDFGRPSAEACRFINEHTGPDKPRVSRNALVLAVPSIDGLAAARAAVADHLAWKCVQHDQAGKNLDPARQQALTNAVESSRKQIGEKIRQAYCIAVTVSEDNEIRAYKIAVGGGPLFTHIKDDKRCRIQETAITAEALLPGGPYDLWRPGEAARWVKDLVGAFAQVPRLPKMLDRGAIFDTLANACREGLLVLRLRRPDGSFRTWWRVAPDGEALRDPRLEAVLPEAATLSEVPASLLEPGKLPGLWSGPEIKVSDVLDYFAGGKVIQVDRGGYQEPVTIPHAPQEVVEGAIASAVRAGRLWLIAGPASLLEEDIPPGVLTPEARLQAPPAPIAPGELLPARLTAARQGEVTTALAIAEALSQSAGKPLPWATVRKAIDQALVSRFLERTPESAEWPCDYAHADSVMLKVPEVIRSGSGDSNHGQLVIHEPGPAKAQAELQPSQIQDLAEKVGEIREAAAGYPLKFRLEIELGGSAGVKPPADTVERVNQVLAAISDELRLE